MKTIRVTIEYGEDVVSEDGGKKFISEIMRRNYISCLLGNPLDTDEQFVSHVALKAYRMVKVDAAAKEQCSA